MAPTSVEDTTMNVSIVTSEQLKAATREQWNRDAKGWSDHSPPIRAWLRPSTDAMLSMAGIAPGHRVLDVAAGAGDQTLDIAARIGARGSVLATDLSPAILEFARQRAVEAGYANIELQAADGENMGVLPASFDAVVCRLGLMLFPDPARGLREMFQALKRGGRCCTMVFSSVEQNPCMKVLIGTAFKHAGLPPRDPYAPGGLLSLGKPGLIDDLFREAGFVGVATTKVAAPFRLPSVNEYLNFVRTSASPILQILGRLDQAGQDAAWADIADKLTVFATEDGWVGPNELLLTVGARP
jgi:SAM-dependent methyltransferase